MTRFIKIIISAFLVIIFSTITSCRKDDDYVTVSNPEYTKGIVTPIHFHVQRFDTTIGLKLDYEESYIYGFTIKIYRNNIIVQEWNNAYSESYKSFCIELKTEEEKKSPQELFIEIEYNGEIRKTDKITV